MPAAASAIGSLPEIKKRQKTNRMMIFNNLTIHKKTKEAGE